MKVRELREMTEDKLVETIAGIEEELFNLRFQAKLGQLSNPLQLRLRRRDKARAKTVLSQLRQKKAPTT